MSGVDPAAGRPPGAEPGSPDEPVEQPAAEADASVPSGDQPAPGEGTEVAEEDAELVEAVDLATRLERERDEYLDLARRVQADFENYKRRVEAQRDEQRQRAAEDLVRELLPVLDAGEAAVAHGSEDASQLHAQLLTILEKSGLTRVAADGVEFDPNVHEAVSHEEGDDESPVVVEVMRTGYLWNQRVLRPAMVKVRG